MDNNGEPCYVVLEQPPRPLYELAGNLVSFAQPGETWDSLLKFSGGISGQTFTFTAAGQGRESCMDLNNVSGLRFDSEVFLGAPGSVGECAVKIKGGSFAIKADYRVVIMSETTKADIIIGEWSDQNTGPCFGLVPFVAMAERRDKKPVTVSVGRVTWMEFQAIRKLPNIRFLYWRSLGEAAYWWGKFALVKTGIWELGAKIQALFSKKAAQ